MSLANGVAVPTREEFAHRIGSQPVLPVVRRLLADTETPISVYRKLCGGRPGTFLLESAEAGSGVWSRYSFVGVRAVATLTEQDGTARWLGTPPPGVDNGSSDPLEALRGAVTALRSPRDPELPPLTAGLVGYLSYDVVRRLERLPVIAEDDLGMPELGMMLVTDLAVLDHSDGTVLLVANGFQGQDPGSEYDDCVARLDAMTRALAEPMAASIAQVPEHAAATPTGRTDAATYRAGVERIKEEIRAGEAFQVVLSQRLEVEVKADALDVYRALRASNPSPYMYLLRFAGRESPYDVVGSSPEALVKVTEGRALLHPIAGTRPRGATPDEDARLAAELLADPKERSEHVMLVDLGRNDLGRVCEPGSVEVVDFMSVERFSHVMHIVSSVVGEVAPDRHALDVLTACFPAGTLTGAPKPRAMEIIESLEPTRRALYGGVVGYLDAAGDLDTAIAIRTAVLHQGRAYVQAGAGIVADSDPESENAECHNKAAAVLRAIAAAEAMDAVT